LKIVTTPMLPHWRILAPLFVALLVIGGFLWWEEVEAPGNGLPLGVASFDDCAKYYAILESYPRQCKTPDGRTFTESLGLPAQAGNELDKSDLIRVSTPRPNATIASPLTVSGEARGYWYFEATFPIELRNAEGLVIAQHYVQAQDEWMTEEFVPFQAQLPFPAQPAGSRGTLILRKDNPSGLPENDDQLVIPVAF